MYQEECSTTLPGSAKKPTEVEQQMERLAKMIEELGSQVAQMESSLNVVLRGENDKSENSATPRPSLTPLASAIRDASDRVGIYSSKLIEIRNRL